MPLKVPVEQTGLERSIQNAAKSAGRNLKINLGTSAKDIKSLEQPLGRITGKADEFGKSMEAANARVLAFGASVGIINAVAQSFKNLVSTTIEVEASLAKINSILKTTTSGLNTLKGQIFDIARNTEQTFDTVAEAALELSRQGLSATEVTKRLNDSLILSRLAGINAAEAVGGLTAAVNSFSKAGLTTGEVLNKISNAANQFAVSERDLIEGFKRSASVAQQAGVSIDELGGIITAVQQKTARGGAVIGNSFKTIFTRIGKADNLKLLQDVGVTVADLEGNILPATKIIENLAKKFDQLDGAVQRNVAFKVGGGFQIAPLLAALQDYSDENSIAIRATEAFANATDQAYQKNTALNQTLSAAIQQTSLSVKELANTLGELGVSDTFKNLLGFFNSFVSSFQKLLEGDDFTSKLTRGLTKGLTTSLLQGGLALFGFIILKLSKDLGKFAVGSFKTFFGLNKEAEKLKNIQEQIVGVLLGDKGVRQDILNIEKNSANQEEARRKQAEYFNTILRERAKITSQIAGIGAGVAPILGGGGRTLLGNTKRGAGGFLPVGAEQKDISRGVGGAPKGAKPVVIPNFAFGGGKRGTMVANDSEYIVPNFAGGGSAIFNQDMARSMGLPKGARKINSAGGFIPNFARTQTVDEKKFGELLRARYPEAVTNGSWDRTKAVPLLQADGIDVTTRGAQLSSLYRNSPLRQEWNSLSQTQKNQFALRGKQRRGLSQTSTQQGKYGLLYPDAVGGAATQNIPVGEVDGVSYVAKAIPVESRVPTQLYSDVRDGLIDAATKYISKIGFPASFLDRAGFREDVSISLNEGNVKQAFGATFDAGFTGALGSKQRSNAIWDLPSSSAIKSLYDKLVKGSPLKKTQVDIAGLKAADFKNSLSSTNKQSFLGKILNSEKGPAEAVLPAPRNPNAAGGYIPNFATGVGIYDSDYLQGSNKKLVLDQILASKKRKDLLVAPAGAGKSTVTQKTGGKPILSVKDIAKFSKYLILSASAKGKNSLFTAPFQKILDSVKSSGGDIQYLYVSNDELDKRRRKRLNEGAIDPRGEKSLRGTLRAPKNQFDFISGLKRTGASVIRGAGGYIPNFAGVGKGQKDISARAATISELSAYRPVRQEVEKINKAYAAGKKVNKKAGKAVSSARKIVHATDKVYSPKIEIERLNSNYVKSLLRKKAEGAEKARKAEKDFEVYVARKTGGDLTDTIRQGKGGKETGVRGGSSAALDVIRSGEFVGEVKSGFADTAKIQEKFLRFPIENYQKEIRKDYFSGEFSKNTKDQLRYKENLGAKLFIPSEEAKKFAKDIVKKKRKGNAASGYIPNFAMSPLEDAIQREKDAGIPVNQIRINQDGKLRNSQNPAGIAVTNTRDEPTGKIPNFADRGYVPNYVGLQAGVKEAALKNVEKLGKNADKASKGLDKTAKSGEKGGDSLGKLVGISSITFALQGAFGGLSEETTGLKRGFLEISQGITTAVATLYALQSVGIGVGGIAPATGKQFGRGVLRRGRQDFIAARNSFKEGGIKGKSVGVGRRALGVGRFAGGKLLVGFTRLVPLLGSLVIGFQVLNPILKQFGVDLSLVGEGLKSSSDRFVESVNKSQKAFDSFGTKLAERAGSGELSGVNIVEEFRKDFLNSLKAQRAGIKVEDGASLSPADLLRASLRTQSGGRSLSDISTQGRVAREASFGNFFTNTSGGLLEYFRSFGGDGFNDTSKSFSTKAFFFGREAGQVIEGTDIDLKDSEVKKAVETAESNFNEVLNGALVTLISKQDIKENELDLTTPKGLKKGLGIAIKKLSKDFDKKSEDAFNQVIKDSAEQGLTLEQTKVRVASLLRDLGYEEAAKDVEKVNKKVIAQEKRLNAIKKINADIFKLKTDETFKQQQLLRSIRTQQEFQLELEKSSIRTSSVRKLQIEQELRGTEDIRQARIKIAETIRGSLSGNESIKTLLTAGLDDKVALDNAKNYETIVNKIALQYAATGKLNKELLADELEKIQVIEGNEDSREKILNFLEEEVKLASQSISLEQIKKNLYEDQKRLIELRNQAEKDLLDITERNFSAQEKAAKSRIEQQIAAIEKEKELRGIRFGTGRPSIQGIFDRQDDRSIQSSRQQISDIETFSKIRQDLTKLAQDRGVSGDFSKSPEFKRFLENRNDVTARESAKVLDRLIAESSQNRERILQDSINKMQEAVEKGVGKGLSAPATRIENGGTRILEAANKIEKAFEEKGIFAGIEKMAGALASVVTLEGQKERLSKSKGEIKEIESKLTGLRKNFESALLDLKTARENLKNEGTTKAASNYFEKNKNLDKANAELKEALDLKVAKEEEKKKIEELIAEKEKEIQATEDLVKKIIEKTGELDGKKEKPDTVGPLNRFRRLPPVVNGKEQGVSTQISRGKNLSTEVRANRFLSQPNIQPVAESTADERLRELEEQRKTENAKTASELDRLNAQKTAVDIQYQTQLIKARDAASIVAAERELKLNLELLKIAEKYVDLRSQAIDRGASKEELRDLEKRARIEEAQAQARSEDVSISERLRSKGVTDKQAIDNLKTALVDGADQFVNTISDGLVDAIIQGKSLGDVLRAAATDFFTGIAKASLNNLLKGAFFGGGGGGGGILGGVVSGISGLFGSNKNAQGGMITGGSGSKDDVPAMLMGGEYVIKKSAVNKYGPQFMDAINSGQLGGFARGGEVQSGRGGFFTPGTFGGTIKGKRDLLSFAGQGFTSGANDFIGSSAGLYGGATAVGLEPESARLTNVGRTLGTPLQQATEEAKQQAFGLYVQQVNLEKQLAEQEKARKKALKNSIISAVAGLAISALPSIAKGFKFGVDNAGGLTGGGFGQFLKGIGGGLKGAVVGGKVKGFEGLGNFGGLVNAFNSRGSIGSVADLGKYSFNNPSADLSKQFTSLRKPLEAVPSTYADILKRSPQTRATGGYIPDEAGVDTVPAMLSGGEFVMNSAAADRIGRGNLERLNSGSSDGDGGGIASKELVDKLDELIDVTKDSTGEVNITVNGGSGDESSEQSGSSQEDAEKRRNLAKKIKEEVLKVIKEEKRLGGTLRNDKL